MGAFMVNGDTHSVLLPKLTSVGMGHRAHAGETMLRANDRRKDFMMGVEDGRGQDGSAESSFDLRLAPT